MTEPFKDAIRSGGTMRTGNAVRASDAERDAVGETLRRHHAEGRIDTDELQERIHRCYSARTRAELELLLTDLPPDPAREHAGRHGPRHWWPVAVAFFVILALTSPDGHDHRQFGVWPLLLVAFLFFRLARGRIGRYWPTARSRP